MNPNVPFAQAGPLPLFLLVMVLIVAPARYVISFRFRPTAAEAKVQ